MSQCLGSDSYVVFKLSNTPLKIHKIYVSMWLKFRIHPKGLNKLITMEHNKRREFIKMSAFTPSYNDKNSAESIWYQVNEEINFKNNPKLFEAEHAA
jgi:hypothetical protein